jgi:hypothetical protein
MSLEERYLREQAAQPMATTTTTTIKMTDAEVVKLMDCSKHDSSKLKGFVSGGKYGDYEMFTVEGKPFCKKQI